jgi:serine/threonine-protein kinase
MSDLLQRLQQALGDSYRIERELGGGGMSRVFVAEESALGRKVVVKVLPPELAAGLNIERFRREIQLAASLQHPHIVPLHAAGQADGLLYFTMPLVEGESLRTKLAREGEQPIGETIRILRDIVDALAYAHPRGVVHRDIKPDNVLVSHHHALVTDFGVAKALSESTGRAAVTSAGVALGTPAYMAPEQAAADPHTDHRADIYAVGAVAYEMLAGRPPFTGPTSQIVLAAHVTKTPEPIADLRASVPPALASLVMRCLAKKPADRWQSAEELLHQLEAMATPSGGTAPTEVTRAVARKRGWAVLAGGLLVAAAVIGWMLRGPHASSSPAADPHAVAVFPFRVSGADPSLAYLQEGMVELLAVKLTGEGGPRAVDPSATLSVWRRAGGGAQELDRAAALQAARALGAARALQGSIVGSPARLTLTAAVLGDSRDDARVSVEGPLDSLSNLVDRLTAGVLAGGTEGKGALSQLTTTSLPSLRAYLDGRSLYRRGSYREAVSYFERALALDSSFALAGLGLANAAGWCCAGVDRGLRLAWAGRDRLGVTDRAVLEAMAGPHYPDASSNLEHLRAWERAVEAASDRPDAWYGLGDLLFHWGFVLGIPDPWQRAERAFQRSVELDSTFAGPLEHMVEMAARAGDTGTTARLVRLALASDSSSEISSYLRWRLAVAKGDTLALTRMGSALDGWPLQSLFVTLIVIEHDGLPIRESGPVMAAVAKRTSTREERRNAAYFRWTVGLNAGRPADALRGAESNPDLDDNPRTNHAWKLVQAAFWDGDSAAAAAAARELQARPAAPASHEDLDEAVAQRCALEQWRLAQGDLKQVDRTISELQRPDTVHGGRDTRALAAFCSRMLDAWQAVLRRSPDAGRKVTSLDSAARSGPSRWLNHFQQANLLLARLYETEGDLPRALDALRRRHFGLGIPLYLSSYLREEGRLAAVTGDRAGAIAAYRHYLALRDDPEPSIKPRVDEVRKELAKLLAER